MFLKVAKEKKIIEISKPKKEGSTDFFKAFFYGDALRVLETKNEEDSEYVLKDDYMTQKFLDFDLDFGAFDNAVNQLNKKEPKISSFLKEYISRFSKEPNTEEKSISEKDKNMRAKP